jgi:hypothetical protein
MFKYHELRSTRKLTVRVLLNPELGVVNLILFAELEDLSLQFEPFCYLVSSEELNQLIVIMGPHMGVLKSECA